MKSLITFSLCFIIFGFTSCKENKTTLEETEIKQPEPAKERVQPFAQHIFSQFTNVRDFTMSTSEDEAYFSLQSPGRELSVIMKIETKDDNWQDPQISPFSGRYNDLEPFMSPDNLKLYFVSNRPISKDSTNTKDMDI